MKPAEEDALVEEVVAKYRSSATPFPQCIRLAIRAAYAQGLADASGSFVANTGYPAMRVETDAIDLSYEIATGDCAAAIRRGD